MATSNIRAPRVLVDTENPTFRAKGKLLKKPTQRAALGEIGNKVPTKAVAIKKEPQKAVVKPTVKPKEIPVAKDVKPKEKPAKVQIEKTHNVVKVQETQLKPLNLKQDWLKSTDLVVPRNNREVPSGVVNIDEQDSKNIFLLSCFVFDIFEYLKTVEAQYSVRYMHLSHLEVTGYMRATLVDWLVDVQVQFNLIQETFQMAVSILDRYLQDAEGVSGKNLQLVGIGCLLIACKYEETYPPEIDDFVYMSNSAFLKAEILEMESKILSALKFNLGKPVPITFLRRYSKTTSAEPRQHSFAKYFIELALMDYKLCSEKPSLIAAVSLYIAQRIMCVDDDIAINAIWNPTISYYSGYTLSHFENLIPRLAACIRQASLSKLKALRSKYSSSKFHKVSLSSYLEPNSKILEELIDGKNAAL